MLKKRALQVVVMVVAIVLSGSGQERQSVIDAFMDQSQKPPEGQLAAMRLPPMDAPVDPAGYLVGPGDLFGINVWSTVPVNFSLYVSPEGVLVVPTVGEIDLRGRSLAEAKVAVLEAIRKKYKTEQGSVALLVPRTVAVYVRGEVVHPGRYSLFASDRVDKAIRRANGVVTDEVNAPATGQMSESELRLSEDFADAMSTRNILVRRRSGVVLRVDLPMFHATGEARWNPCLAEGDEIIVPPRDGNRNSFGVFGGVNLPGRFEFVEGQTLADAIVLARDFSPTATQDSVLLLRMKEEGSAFDQRVVSMETDEEIEAASGIRLVSGDRVVVPYRRELRGDEHVEIAGEILKPGKYPILRGTTRLADVIRMAGGFTPEALIPAGEVLRKPAGERLSDKTAAMLGAMAGLSEVEDTVYFRIETLRRADHERVSVSFADLFLRSDSTENVLLMDGDRIVIPSRRRTVYVYGQVVRPGHLPWVAGFSAGEYVDRAGGYLEGARTGDILVLKASSGQWVSDEDLGNIDEGDIIWIPKDPQLRITQTMQIISQIATVISVILSMTVIIVQLTASK